MDSDNLDGSPSKRRQYRAYNLITVLAMSFGSLSFGYSNNIISTTFGQPTFIKYFELDTRSNATELKGVMNGGYHAAAFIGVLFVGSLADRWGRKVAISVGALLTLIAGAGLAGSVHVAMFIVFRFVSGAGSSILLAGVPLWMNEVVPAANRGVLVDIHGAVFQFGFAVASWVGYGFYFLTTKSMDAWRPPLAFQCLPPIITLSIIYWLPESPRWLLMRGRVDDARSILLRSHTASEAQIELDRIQAQMSVDRTLNNSYIHMFRKASYRKRCLLAIGTCMMANCSGILVINNYGPTIYGSLGYDSEKQLLLSAVWSTFGIFCSFCGFLFVDRLPRPRLLTMGLSGCVVCLIVLAAMIANYGSSQNFVALKASVAMIFIYEFFWCGVLSGTQFVYCGELFPSHLRAKGLSLGVAGINLANVIFLTVAPTAFANIGWRYYLVFIILSGISAIVIFFVWPDTRGVPLEEIAALFGDYDEISEPHALQQDVQVVPQVEYGASKEVSTHHEVAVKSLE
ncbi:hypothetical protein CLAIMM_11266 isoform 1 [Cladophialophora immunda]|nr:hypothetical protein CLAIMM_11266 isoform 1 [Cladophialophora immunda]